MSKKAQMDLMGGTIVELIILVLIILLMSFMAYRELSATKYDKMFLSRDIALFLDTTYASPNKLIIRYPQNTLGYSFVIGSGEVVTFKESETLALGESFPYTEETELKVENKKISPKIITDNTKQDSWLTILFRKSDSSIKVSSGEITSKLLDASEP